LTENEVNPTSGSPGVSPRTFLDFPPAGDLDSFQADIAILGIPFGMPYGRDAAANDQSRSPDAIRHFAGPSDIHESKHHFDWDLRGPLLDGRDVVVVDCGNVAADPSDPRRHYARAEEAARRIFRRGTTLIALGGDHGVSIPVMRALEVFGSKVTLVHVDAHLDWRDDIDGEKEGYSSPIRRASEMPWIDGIHQIGMRGVGSAREQEVSDAGAYGASIVDAYEVHDTGIDAVIDRIPDRGPYYLTIDADGLDPSIMPAVISPTPGGLSWVQIRKLVHALVRKGRVVGLDLVEIAPSRDIGKTTVIHAERLICNFIGACVRAGYYDAKRDVHLFGFDFPPPAEG
jgi:agmatinase